MRLSTLLSTWPDHLPQTASGDPDITLVTADSRQVKPGTLFVAVRGDNVDGHRYIPNALGRGAAAIVTEGGPDAFAGPGAVALVVDDARAALGWLSAAWHGVPARRLTLIGITGTDGKTTTASLIHDILQAAGHKAGMISTVNALVGGETLDTGFHVTTPDAPDVQSYLARMVQAGLTHCVLEVTSHALAQRRVTGCEFDVAVITNVTHEHLDYHKTYAGYLAAKGQLFEMLAESAVKPGGPAKTGVLNLDDASYPYLAQVLQARRLAYSLSPAQRHGAAPDLWASGVTASPAGLSFDAAGPGSGFAVRTSLVGGFNISNCLAAIAATVGALGAPSAAAQQALAAFGGVPGRMERIDLGQPFTALVDFAHTPNALRQALETARQLAAGGSRLIAVFGSAGLRDLEKRRLMAEVSAELADVSILTAEDPRTESLDAILDQMAAGARIRGAVERSPEALAAGAPSGAFCRVPDRGEALRLAVSLAHPGDLVIACGKGHEQSMCFGEVEYPWDDRTALRAALAEQLGRAGPAMPRLPTSTAPAQEGPGGSAKMTGDG
jgi:UDP-N-acetylmuramoyl-L-alanyl-D-glutamate--2,6-diaminopimelate ligase